MSAILRVFLYPTLALTALGIFVAGLIHLLFCQTFFFVLPGLIDGIFVLIAAFHGMFLRYPDRYSFDKKNYNLLVSVFVSTAL